ncbi:hypothetical protein GCM10023195_47090 [Actinoallomurus liliacearum]|uniref:Uncharacterized protein n=1 Tax=Actinoallomurus liliacearum TaxID=1080073 RepID=A0ABP8TQ02_9ACTN
MPNARLTGREKRRIPPFRASDPLVTELFAPALAAIIAESGVGQNVGGASEGATPDDDVRPPLRFEEWGPTGIG